MTKNFGCRNTSHFAFPDFEGSGAKRIRGEYRGNLGKFAFSHVLTTIKRTVIVCFEEILFLLGYSVNSLGNVLNYSHYS